MRIKYRIWDNENKCYFEPTYKAYAGKLSELLMWPSGDLSLRTIDGMTHCDSVMPDRFVIEQFIGHQDAYSTDIYVGDKLQVNNSIVYEIVFLLEDEYEEKIASFGLKSTKGTFAIDHFAIENGRVIGNIHEEQDGEVR